MEKAEKLEGGAFSVVTVSGKEYEKYRSVCIFLETACPYSFIKSEKDGRQIPTT